MPDFDCGTHVSQRIYALLGSNPASLTPAARAQLARLRQAAPLPPGAAPNVWGVTFEGVPELPEKQLERVEWAIHVALTQFALHQQSRNRAMHDPKQPFGRAVRILCQATSGDAEPQESPTYRRFSAMSMAKDMVGLVTHARGIISQLRTHDIAFNYGQYARDLYLFQVPGFSVDVQRRWGRNFHYLTTTELSEGSN